MCLQGSFPVRNSTSCSWIWVVFCVTLFVVVNMPTSAMTYIRTVGSIHKFWHFLTVKSQSLRGEKVSILLVYGYEIRVPYTEIGRMSWSYESPWRLITFALWRAVFISLRCLVLAVHIWKTPKGANIQYSDWLFQPSWKWDVTKAPENKRSSQLAWVEKVIVNIVICVCEGLTAIEQTFAVAFGWEINIHFLPEFMTVSGGTNLFMLAEQGKVSLLRMFRVKDLS